MELDQDFYCWVFASATVSHIYLVLHRTMLLLLVVVWQPKRQEHGSFSREEEEDEEEYART
jgi:hypothetical protein